MEDATQKDALLAEFDTTMRSLDVLRTQAEAEIKAHAELPVLSAPVDIARKNDADTRGRVLGGPLSDVINNALDKETLGEHADKLVEDSIKSLSARLKKLEELDKGAADAVDKLAEVLVEELGVVASDVIKGEGVALVDAVQGVVDENPVFIATMALVAAALAVSFIQHEDPEAEGEVQALGQAGCRGRCQPGQAQREPP